MLETDSANHISTWEGNSELCHDGVCHSVNTPLKEAKDNTEVQMILF